MIIFTIAMHFLQDYFHFEEIRMEQGSDQSSEYKNNLSKYNLCSFYEFQFFD